MWLNESDGSASKNSAEAAASTAATPSGAGSADSDAASTSADTKASTSGTTTPAASTTSTSSSSYSSSSPSSYGSSSSYSSPSTYSGSSTYSSPPTYSGPSTYTTPSSYSAPSSYSSSAYGTSKSAATETAMVSPALAENTTPAATAPMCTLGAFKASTMVSTGGWPGIGPFRSTGDNVFLDKTGNTLKLDLSGDRVARVQLTLVNRKYAQRTAKDLLDIQMAIDFLLEAVGVKPKKILEFNDKLTASKQDVLSTSNSIALTTGRTSVQIGKQPSANPAATDYIVSVNSLDASRNSIAEHAKASDSGSDKDARTSDAAPAIVRTATGTTSAANTQDLKAQFTQLLDNWQRVKRVALRTRQPDQLSTILGGRALTRQTDAIKWLVDHHKYYDMVPKGVYVDRFNEILPQRKYMVLAQVREASKYKDDSAGDVVIKETDDTYKVNYTVEKIGGRWLITDSALLTKSQVTPVKTSTGKQAH